MWVDSKLVFNIALWVRFVASTTVDLALSESLINARVIPDRELLITETPNEARKRQDILGQFLIDNFSAGNHEIVRDTFGHQCIDWSHNDLNKCLLYVIEHGTVDLLGFLLRENNEYWKKELLSKIFLGALIYHAAYWNKVDILGLFLVDLAEHEAFSICSILPKAFAVAVASGSLEAMRFLLGTDWQRHFLSESEAGWTFSDIEVHAVNSGRIEMVQELEALKGGTFGKVDLRFKTLDWAMTENAPLRLACHRGFANIAQHLLRVDAENNFINPGIDPGARHNDSLVTACRNGHFDIVRLLLTMKDDKTQLYPTVKVDAQHNAPLIYAITYGHLDIVKLLLQQVRGDDGTLGYKYSGVDPTAQNHYPVTISAMTGHVAILEFLLQNHHPGIEIPKRLWTLVTRRGLTNVLKVLLQSQAKDQQPPPDLASASSKEIAIHFQSQALNYFPPAAGHLYLLKHVATRLGIEKLDTILPHLYPNFIEEHIHQVVFAAASMGDLESVVGLRDKIDLQDSRMTAALARGIAYYGDVSFLKDIESSLPAIRNYLHRVVVAASSLDRLTFLDQVLQMALENMQTLKVKDFISKITVGICSSGSLASVQFAERSLKPIELFDVFYSLIRAEVDGNFEVLKYLLQTHRSAFESVINTVLYSAADLNHVEILEFLLLDSKNQRYFDLDTVIPKAIAYAASAGSLAAVDLLLGVDHKGHLLAPRLDFNSESGITIFNKAISSGRLEVITYMLDRATWKGLDADPRFQDLLQATVWKSTVAVACEAGELEILQYLLRQDENKRFRISKIAPGYDSNRALKMACEKGHVRLVQELLKADKDGRPMYKSVDRKAIDRKMVIKAISAGHTDMVQFLLHRVMGKDGIFVYEFPEIAARTRDVFWLNAGLAYRNIDVIKLLLQRNPRVPTILVETAKRLGYEEIVDELLKYPTEDED